MDTRPEYPNLEHLARVPSSRREPSHISSQGKEAASVTHDIYVMHQQDRLLLSQLCLTFPSSMDGARKRNRWKWPRLSELDNRTPPAMSDRAQFGA